MKAYLEIKEVTAEECTLREYTGNIHDKETRGYRVKYTSSGITTWIEKDKFEDRFIVDVDK